MRSSLSTLLGAGVAFCIAFAPVPAVADTLTQRVDLGQQQTTTQQVRWQPTARSEAVTQPWTVVSSSQRVERTPTRGGRTQDQKFKTDVWQQLTTQYPLEAKQVQDQTTTTRNYELRTYQIVTTTSTVSVPGTQEVGAWATQDTLVPVTITVQKPVVRPVLVAKEVPVYKTVTSTYSQPILTPLQTTKTVYQSQQVTETRYKDVTTTTDKTYNGKIYDLNTKTVIGTLVVDSNEQGMTIANPGTWTLHLDFKPWQLPTQPGAPGVIVYSASYMGPHHVWYAGTTHYCSIWNVGDHDSLTFDADFDHNGGTRFSAILDRHLIDHVVTTQKVPYTVTTTQQIPVTVPVNFSMQLEHMTNTPKDLCGTDATNGVYWTDYHYAGDSCPFKAVNYTSSFKWIKIGSNYVYASVTDDTELNAAKAKAVMVGSAASRVAGLNADDQSAFTVEYHHTDVLPQFADDATILSKTEQVFDHNDVQMVWENQMTFVPEQVPVTHVVGWIPGPYRHTHGDPSVQCDNTHVGHVVAGVVCHTATPVFVPRMQTIESHVWATHSIPVTEVKTVTSTSSVLVSQVPGVETSVTTGPWMDTGETRRGTGILSSISKSIDSLLGTWIEPSQDVPAAVATTNRSNTSVYMSDFRSGTSQSKQSLVGSSVRRLLNSSNAAVTQAKQTTQPTRETGRQEGIRHDDQFSGGSVADAMVSPKTQGSASLELGGRDSTDHWRRDREH